MPPLSKDSGYYTVDGDKLPILRWSDGGTVVMIQERVDSGLGRSNDMGRGYVGIFKNRLNRFSFSDPSPVGLLL